MQDRPTVEELLLAVADFVEGALRPAIQDEALAFRALIAANLARMAVLERRLEEWHDGVELDGLRHLVSGLPPAPADAEGRRALVAEANARLAARLRGAGVDGGVGDGEDPDAAFVRATAAHLRAVLAGRLHVTNPRFDVDFGWPG